MKQFQGRVITPGEVTAEVVVTKETLYTYDLEEITLVK